MCVSAAYPSRGQSAAGFMDLLDGCAAFVRSNGVKETERFRFVRTPRFLCDGCSTGHGTARVVGTEMTATLGLRKAPKTFRDGVENPRWGQIDATCRSDPVGSPLWAVAEADILHWLTEVRDGSGLEVLRRGQGPYADRAIDEFFVCSSGGAPFVVFVLSQDTQNGTVPLVTFDARRGSDYCLGGHK